MMLMPPDFHFLRPWWFLSLVPCAFLLYLLWRHGSSSRNLEEICDPSLLSFLVMDRGRAARPWPLLLVGVCWFTAAAALAGPVWEKQPSPLYNIRAGRVVLLDLSPSMAAEDIKPSRLKRAKFKIMDMLERSREGFTGLVVFSSQAYVVVPLTDDVATIKAMLPALSVSIMPEQGNNVEEGLRRAAGLLVNAGIRSGEIVLVTDGVSDMASCITEISRLRSKGIRISVLGIGTARGAPVPDHSGGFLHDASGSPVISGLDADALRELARAGGGTYSGLTVDDSDIRRLLPEISNHAPAWAGRRRQGHADQWREQGAWLVLPLLLAALAGFRRGWFLALFIMLLLGNASPVMAFHWKDLWQTREQQAWNLYNQGSYRDAAGLFRDSRRKAAALYRAGRYAEAAKLLESLHGADAAYNMGNSLARAGKFKDAIRAYDHALEQDPDNADAAFNRDLVKKLLEQQENRQSEKESRDAGDKGSDREKSDKDKEQAGKGKQQGRDRQEKRGGKEADARNSRDRSSNSTLDKRGQEQHKNHGSPDHEDRAMQQNKKQEDHAITSDRDEKKDNKSGKAVHAAPQPAMGNNTREHESRRTEKEMALEQWLRQVPDDPSGLLRRKFLLEYQQRRRAR